MKLAYSSDMHFEFGTQDDIRLEEQVDVLVLAGDIDSAKNVVNRSVEIANGKADQVVFVCGNHEFYGTRVDKAFRQIAEQLEGHNNVHFLNNSFVDLDGYRFLGGTCWTDFNLDGNQPLAMEMARNMMNDYRRIQICADGVYRKLLPRDTLKMNLMTKQFIFDQLGKQQEEGNLDKTVVVTHHGPTHLSLDPEFNGDPLNPAYASAWGNELAYLGPKLWLSGHVHCRRRYYCGETLCISNPYGYPGQNLWAGIHIIDTDKFPTKEQVESKFDGFIPER